MAGDTAVAPSPPGFEGPEKKLEMDFRRRVGSEKGLREVPDDVWQKMLDLAKCTIISKKESETCTMYLLSESSLFVYSRKLVLKTCGTTTLLHVAPFIIDLISADSNAVSSQLKERLGLQVEYLSYSRKNFIYPDRQEQPHTSFPDEIKYLTKYFPDGGGYVMGPLNGEHWNFFVADYTLPQDEELNPPDQTFEVIMSGLSTERTKHYFQAEGRNSQTATTDSGIEDILPGSTIDAFLFEPCGYSMNGLAPGGQYYWTIHITPEEHCSFASFETNLPREEYSDVVQRVLKVFDPSHVVVTLFADSKCEKTGAHALPQIPEGYRTKHRTVYDFERPYTLSLLDLVKCSVTSPKAQ